MARNRVATRKFREKKNITSTLTWITENELKRKITAKGKNFVGKLTSKFYIGGEKARNASG